jgi:hypothetical protein
MMSHPASQLTKYLERVAVYLRDNRPSFVDKYGVTVQTFKSGEDAHTIRLAINLTISEAKLKQLDVAGVIERES